VPSEPSRPPSTTTTTSPPPTKTAEKIDATDGKGADAGKEADKSLLNEKGEAAKGAPEKYEDFKVPEGYTLEETTGNEFRDLAKRNDISQSTAQELVDFYIAKTREAQQRPMDVWRGVQEQWKDEIRGDANIGGSRLNGTVQSIGKMIDSLGDAKLAEGVREAMDYTGAGNNPAVVRFLFALSQRLNEGGAVRGGGPSTEGQRAPGQAAPSAAQAMYPHLPSNQTR
jgi:hypothetical protein